MTRNRFGLAVLALLFLGAAMGCTSVLAVKIPKDQFVSPGDYVEGVRTEGIIQAHKRAWTPFIVLYDESSVREDLYKQLISKSSDLSSIDGITNINFYSKVAPASVLAPFTFGLGIWRDYYVEGVVITKKK